MANDKKVVVNLDELVTLGRYISIGGKEHLVKDMDGVCYDMLVKMQTSEQSNEHVAVLYGIAQRCVPSLTDDQVRLLTPTQVNKIIEVSTNKIQDVEAMITDLSKAVTEGNAEEPPTPPVTA